MMLCQGCQILAHSDMPDDMPDNLVLARDLSMSGHSSGGAKIDLHEKTPALAKDAGAMNQPWPLQSGRILAGRAGHRIENPKLRLRFPEKDRRADSRNRNPAQRARGGVLGD